MNKAKTDDKVKITVVHQRDVSNHHNTEHLGDHDTLEQKITVVDEPFSTYLQAKWLTLMRSPLLFVASLILAMAMGYLSAYWRYQRGVQISKELAASKNEGNAIKKKEDAHKMAEANKAFSHFRV